MQTRGVSISFVVSSQNQKYDDFNEKIYRSGIILVHIWRIRPPGIPEPAILGACHSLSSHGTSKGACAPPKRHDSPSNGLCKGIYEAHHGSLSKNGLKQDRPFCWGLKTWPFFGGHRFSPRRNARFFSRHHETPRVTEVFSNPTFHGFVSRTASGTSVELRASWGERLELLGFGCVG